MSAAGREVMITATAPVLSPGPRVVPTAPRSASSSDSRHSRRWHCRGPALASAKGCSGMPPVALVDPATIDTSRVLVDREGIRRGNPQRFEMEQLTAIVAIDPEKHLIIGYKDVEPDEFWVRGHMPDYPLMPGVLMCEAAAQLSSYYCHHIKLNEVELHRLRRHGGRPLPRPGPARRPPRAGLEGDPRSIAARRSSRPRGSSRPTWSITAGSSASP